jgi:hypothetical protein
VEKVVYFHRGVVVRCFPVLMTQFADCSSRLLVFGRTVWYLETGGGVVVVVNLTCCDGDLRMEFGLDARRHCNKVHCWVGLFLI